MIATKTLRILLTVLLLGLSAEHADAQRKKQIAVLDFDFATVDLGLAARAYGGKENLARQVADKLITSLVSLGTCQVIERSQLEKVLREQNLGTDGRIDASTAAKVGRILGVDALIIGNVALFELQGLPDSNNDLFWDSKKLRSRIAVNFRVIDTTTAVVELSNEQTGVSSTPPKEGGEGVAKVGKVLGGVFGGNKGGGNSESKVKDEQIRDVVQQALADTVSKITLEVEKYLSGTLKPPEPTMTADKLVSGAIIEVNGPSLIITGIRKNAVRMGDRLYVRRGKVRRDPTTNREIRYSEKVGEVEVVEIQDEVIIGSFSGSGQAQLGDTVTNNPTAQALPSPNQAPSTTVVQTAPPQTAPATTPRPVALPPANTATTAPATNPTTNSAGRQTRTVTVSANLIWNNTGVDVQPGKLVEVVATGAIKISPTRDVAAAGLINRPAPAGLPLPGANIGALIAQICAPEGQCSPVMLIGAQKLLNPGKAGRLMLGINDGDTADNSGALTVTIKW